ncbi:MAG TPA: FtsX-like permease family protein [Gemmatimonadaceae bacterium]|nr:FtsX-like permease family protein [Gemmatimonadaceae bacterium]
MIRRARAIPRLAWRDSRTARRRLLLFMSSIALGVAALVAIDSYTANVREAIRAQSRTILGADLSLTARQPFTGAADSLLDSLGRQGVRLARMTTFASMALAKRTARTRLVQVHAVEPGTPFYGAIQTAPAGRWAGLQHGHNALVDPSLLIDLGVRVGDSLSLGNARFAVIGTLQNVPGDFGVAAALGPRVYIPYRDLAATQLLRFGSRAEYAAQLALPPTVSAEALVRVIRPTLRAAHLRAETVQDTERRLTRAVTQLDRFLGIVGLVALLLGGIGVASAIHAYVVEKIETVAMFRCLGATSAQVIAIYLLESAALGLVGAAVGAALGVAAQFALPHVLGAFMPVSIGPHLEIGPIAEGIAAGVWVAVLFALLPLLSLRRVSALQALRRETEATTGVVRGWLRDWPRLLAVAALVATVVLFAIARAGRVNEGLWMSGGLAVVVLLLTASAAAVSFLARRMLRAYWPYPVRQGVANLFRPANQTGAVILALGFGAFLVSALYLVQTSLLRDLSLGDIAAEANLAFFDIQTDQVDALDSLVRQSGAPVLQRVPIVPMRIAAVNGQAVSEMGRQRRSWALRREYRSSYRDSLVTSETLVAGRWPPDAQAEARAPFGISVDQDVAEELGVALGDSITWNVQGVPVRTRVVSLRKVNWVRFQPNFFVIFPPGALASAPQTFVLLTRVGNDAARARMEHDVIARAPNVSSIDLSLIQQTLGTILGKVSVAIRFMALFSLATGVVVLFSAVAASRRQRLRDAVLLKTLGATRSQIRRILLSEYVVLGLLGSATGMVLSVAGAWALMHFVFTLAFAPAWAPLLAIALGMMLLTSAIGVLSGRAVLAATPMAALRQAT